MSSELSTCQSVMLNPEARVEVGEPRRLKDRDTWAVDIKANGWPRGSNYTTYFGTEAQIRAIAGGHQAAEATDPAQLDALEDPKPEPLSARLDMVDLATRVVGMGAVKSW